MNTAVGIDVSKGRSVVAAMRPFGEVALPPREFLHTSEGLSALSEALRLIDGNTRVILLQYKLRYRHGSQPCLFRFCCQGCTMRGLRSDLSHQGLTTSAQESVSRLSH